jgi:hypothetical protein
MLIAFISKVTNDFCDKALVLLRENFLLLLTTPH